MNQNVKEQNQKTPDEIFDAYIDRLLPERMRLMKQYRKGEIRSDELIDWRWTAEDERAFQEWEAAAAFDDFDYAAWGLGLEGE